MVGYTNHNLGSVFFTAFHNAHQKSKKAKDLLRFLILRPVMSREIASAGEQAATKQLRVDKVWAAAFSERIKITYPLTAAKASVIELSWILPATIRLVAGDATGREIGAQSGSTSPMETTLGPLTSGSSVTVECVRTDALENPFSLQVALADGTSPGRFCTACGHAPRIGAAF